MSSLHIDRAASLRGSERDSNAVGILRGDSYASRKSRTTTRSTEVPLTEMPRGDDGCENKDSNGVDKPT